MCKRISATLSVAHPGNLYFYPAQNPPIAKQIWNTVDAIQLMTYDEGVQGSSWTTHSDATSSNNHINNWATWGAQNNVLDKVKLHVGSAFYGYNNGAGVVGGSKILYKSGTSCSNPGDNTTSVATKLDHCYNNGYGGVMFWELSYDYPVTNSSSLLNAIWNANVVKGGFANTEPCPLPAVIIGPTTICYGTPQVFKTIGWQPGYSWVKSNNLINISNIGLASTTISVASSSSNGSVTLSIKNSNGTTLKTFDIWVGEPISGSISGSSSATAGQDALFFVNAQFPTSVSWTASGNVGSSTSWGNSAEFSVMWSSSCFATISATASNVCASNVTKYHYVTVTGSACVCGLPPNQCICNPWGSPPPYPNPVSDILNIDINECSSFHHDSKDADESDHIFDIRLYDEHGNLLRQSATNGGTTVQFNVSNLPDGIYFLHIYDDENEKPEIKKIMVEH